MSELTVAEFREHFETDLSDAAIQRVIDSVEAEIAGIAGAVGAHSYTINGGARYLFMPTPIDSVTAITETVYDTATVLTPSDYRLIDGGYYIERLHGTSAVNPRYRWGTTVAVNVMHPAASPKRILTTIDIVKMELQYNGVMQENAGGYNKMMANWLTERATLLRSTRKGLPVA